VALETNIDWQALTTGAFTPDYTSLQYGSGAYASQYIGGNLTTIQGWGSGLLIVNGDLTLDGSWFQWYGVILVGGRIIFNNSSYTYVEGALISGLKEGLGTSVSSTTVGNRDVAIYYSSCAVRQALASLTGFAPITNGWVDNWAQY
jgi:hypothetical protein